jgi:N-sulfoglucosamine sulfohydrolase
VISFCITIVDRIVRRHGGRSGPSRKRTGDHVLFHSGLHYPLPENLPQTRLSLWRKMERRRPQGGLTGYPMAMKLSRRSFGQLGLAAAAPGLAQQPSAGPPNLLFLFSDDHTWNDLGCYGNSAVQTPNLDRMASEGMRFNHCYVSSPQCSPNRSSIFTGCAPHTTSTSRLHTPMPPWEPTFLEPLKERGYFTGAFRKVHQGPEFDKRWDFYGGNAPFEKFFDAAPSGRPFFLHSGFTDPHRPYKPGAFSPPHDPAKVIVPPYLPDLPEVRQDIAHYYDFIARMDAECGHIFRILKERGLDQNTLTIFTGDNGMPFPRAKGSCYDPGIRVPMIARWPGQIAPGAVRDELISHVDLPSTWLEAASLPIPAKMQGKSFLNLLQGRSYQPRTEIFAERNWHNNFDPQRAIRTDRYKLILNAAPHFPYRPAWDLRDSPTWQAILGQVGRRATPEIARLMAPTRAAAEFYDLRDDPNEFNNLIESPAQADMMTDLRTRLGWWMRQTYDFLPPAAPAAGDAAGRVWPFVL